MLAHSSPHRTVSCAVLLIALSLFASACSSLEEGIDQEVTILSFPSGADVSVGGRNIGKTPLAVPLGKKIGHEIRITQYGYEPYVTDVLPQFNDEERGTVQFGLAQQTGAYNTLKPDPVLAVLKPVNKPMPDPYEAMMALIEVNDQRLRAGRISEYKHREINEAIMKYFMPR